MRVTSEEPLEFKFHWLNEKGQQAGLFRKRGRYDGETLVLDDARIPSSLIIETAVRDNCVAVAALTPQGTPATWLFGPSSKKLAARLKTALDVARSRVWAEMHRRELEERGRGGTFRAEECPHCGAMLVLTTMPRSPQLYCRFCQSLSTDSSEPDPVPGEAELRLCDECGMFSKPRRFTILYVYFLIFVYGWWSKATWRCPACMRGEAWKMLLGNLLFVVGVPVALAQLIRSYGMTDIGGPFRGLDKGNIKARKGDFEGALAQYRAILERVPHCAGLKYNLGLALLQQGDRQRAADSFHASLSDCSNYAPAYLQLRRLLEELGDAKRLQALKSIWEPADEEFQPQTAPVAP